MKNKSLKALSAALSLSMVLAPVTGVYAEYENSDAAAIVMEMQDPGMTEDASVPENEEAAAQEETEESAEENNSEESNTEESGEQDPGKTEETPEQSEETAVEEIAEKVEAAIVEKVPVDGEYETTATSNAAMFKVVKCVIEVQGGSYTAKVTLSGTGYDKLYLGTKEQAASDAEHAIGYTIDGDGKYVFRLDHVALDTPVAVASHSVKKDQWYDRELTFSSASVKYEEVTTVTPETEFEKDEEQSTPAVDNTTTLDAGEYAPDSFKAEGGTGKVKITCDKIVVKDGKAYATIVFSSKNYTSLKADGKIYTGTIAGKTSTYTIPVTLGVENKISALTTAMSEPHWIEYTITPVLEKKEQTPDPTEAPSPTEAPVPTEAPSPTEAPTPTKTPEKVEDGDYTISAPTTTGKMFSIVSAVLTSKDGVMTAKITLSGTGYDKLFLGTAAEAPEKEASWISYTPDAEGKYVFEIPVKALDEEIMIAAHAVKSGNWFDRGITFQSSTMKKISEEKPSVTPAPTAVPSVSPTPTAAPAPAEESKNEKDLSGSTAAVNSATGLADGVYTPDKFSWSGGSGRVNITCPQVTVKGGKAYATIVFSSPHYGYVKANGSTYYPSVGGGSSTFTIPVQLNANNTIIGMTTAMSVPHEITYSIYIYIPGAGQKAAEELNTSSLSEKAPEIAGLEYQNEIKIENAKYFKMYEYAQGITLIEVDLSTDTDKPDTDDTDKRATDAQTLISDLYKNKVIRYLVVPEGAEVPVGLEKEIVMIHTPVKSVYTDSEEALNTLKDRNQLDLVTVEGTAGETPAYQELVLKENDLAILSSDFLWDKEKEASLEEQSALFYEVTERLTTLEIPALIDRSADEKDQKAQEDWQKVYQAIFG